MSYSSCYLIIYRQEATEKAYGETSHKNSDFFVTYFICLLIPIRMLIDETMYNKWELNIFIYRVFQHELDEHIK